MEDFDNEVISMYKNGMSVREISKTMQCCKQTIYNILNKYNVKFRGHSTRKGSGVPKEQIYEMYDLYAKGKTMREIGDIYNLSKSYVARLFNKQSLEVRDKSKAQRKYIFNECFFDTIDTQEKAYFLGLLWADGTNSTKRHSVAIGLQERDKHILEKMLNIMGADYKLKCIKSKYPGGQDICRLEFFSQHMSDRLNDIGMIPNKSLVLQFPTCIPSDLMPHYIRGVFDGDGYISHGGDYTCEIMGTEDFCVELQKELLKNGIDSKIYNTTLRKETSTRRLYIGRKENVYKFLNYIYKDCTLCIKRKYEIALSKYKIINSTSVA